jgi:hypothetical protein
MTGRYDAAGPESEFQPGSRGRILRNRRRITSVRELERDESEALLAATQQAIRCYRSAAACAVVPARVNSKCNSHTREAGSVA